MNFLLQPKKSKGDPSSIIIHVRITIDRKRVEFSTGIKVLKKDWDEHKKRIKGNSPHNDTLRHLEARFFAIYNECLAKNITPSVEGIIRKYKGVEIPFLLEAYHL